MIALAANPAPAVAQDARDVVVRPGPRQSWSEPLEVAAVPSGFSLRWPSLVSGDGAHYLSATLFPSGSSEKLPSQPFLMILPGEVLPPPPGHFSFLYPVLLPGSPGVLHLLWAEAAEPPVSTTQWIVARPNRLMHAVHTGEGWTSPREIMTTGEIAWGGETIQAVADGGGRLHAVVPTVGQDGRLGLTYLRWEAQQWSRQDFTTLAGTATIDALGSDSVWIGYTGPLEQDAGEARVGIRLLHSGDGGHTWNATEPAPSSPGGIIARLGLLVSRTPAGRPEFNLYWAQSLDGGSDPEVLRVARASEPIGEWALSEDTPIRGTLLRLSGVVDGCGGITTFLETFSEGRIEIEERVWDPLPHPPRTLFPGFTHVANHAASGGATLRLVFSAVPEDGDLARTFLVRRSSCIPDSS